MHKSEEILVSIWRLMLDEKRWLRHSVGWGPNSEMARLTRALICHCANVRIIRPTHFLQAQMTSLCLDYRRLWNPRFGIHSNSFHRTESVASIRYWFVGLQLAHSGSSRYPILNTGEREKTLRGQSRRNYTPTTDGELGFGAQRLRSQRSN